METKRITAIIGDNFHEETIIRIALEAAIERLGEEDGLLVEYASYEQLAERLDRKPTAVILFMEDRVDPHTPAMRRWMTPEIAQRIVEYVQQGGSWLAWHSGLASYEKVGAYIGMLRGHFITHPKEHSVVTYRTEKNELGIPDQASFSFVDEHYFVACDEANTNVFLRSSSRDGESIAGWHHAEGEGKVCCLAPAHLEAGLMNRGQLAILGSVLRWIAS